MDNMPAGPVHRGAVDLTPYLDVEPVGPDVFSSRTLQANFNGAVFGGQIFAQAMLAAIRTVDEYGIHSAHAYFVRPASPGEPVEYAVLRTGDGRSLSNRLVVGRQRGEVVATLGASFHRHEQLLEHQDAMPDVPIPEALLDLPGLAEAYADRLDPSALRHCRLLTPFEIRIIDPEPMLFGTVSPARRRYWLRLPGANAELADLQAAALAYGSDFWLAGVGAIPHASIPPSISLLTASLDHALWFHRRTRADEWLLFDTSSAVATAGRALAKATIFDRSGNIVASAAQEALMRRRAPR